MASSIARSLARPIARSVAGVGESGGASNNSIAVDLTSDLMAAWDFSEASGNRVDEVGGYILAPSSAIGSTTGINGNGASFTGSVQGLILSADNANLRFGDKDWTISMWVNFTGVGSVDYDLIACKGDGGYGQEWRLYRGFTALVLELTGRKTLSFSGMTNGWKFIAIRHKADSNIISLSVNDTELRDTYSGTPADTNKPLAIGCDMVFDSPSGSMTGAIDEVCKWDRYLSSADLMAIYNGATGAFYPFNGAGLDVTAERIIYGVGVPQAIDATKSTATRGTAQDAQVENQYAVVPACNLTYRWANSVVNFGVEGTGEGTTAHITAIDLRAALVDTQVDQLTLDASSLQVGEIAKAATTGSALKKVVPRVRTEINSSSAGTWPANAQVTQSSEFWITATDVINNAFDYNPGKDDQFHFGPAVVTGRVPLWAAIGRQRHSAVIRGDSISPYLETIVKNEGIPHLFLGRAGDAAYYCTRPNGDATRTPITQLADVIVDQYGVNDLGIIRTAAQIQADCITNWTAWVASGNARRLVRIALTPLPSFSTTERNLLNAWFASLNSASLSALVGKTVDYVFVDITTATETAPGSNTWISGYSDDTTHPNATGIAALVSSYQTAIADAISEAF